MFEFLTTENIIEELDRAYSLLREASYSGDISISAIIETRALIERLSCALKKQIVSKDEIIKELNSMLVKQGSTLKAAIDSCNYQTARADKLQKDCPFYG